MREKLVRSTGEVAGAAAPGEGAAADEPLPERLPCGQVWTRKFPVVGEKAPREGALDLGAWRLEIRGLVECPASWNWEEFQRQPRSERVVDIHCVTGWSRANTRIEGVPLALLASQAGVKDGARFVRFVGDTPRQHDTSLPIETALEDTWCVDRIDGRPLAVEHGFPLRTVTPGRYFYKSLKWIRIIEFLAEDRPGFWERESFYHPIGDPWAGDQRFTTGSIDPVALERFRRATSFLPWKRKVLIGLNLEGWEPRTRDLAGLQLKACVLRGARLAGCDLRGANLSLSDLRGADLRGAQLVGADLEGADLAGADLRGADLSFAALTATRLGGTSGAPEALTQGARFDGATGMLEDLERMLQRKPGRVPDSGTE